MKSELVAERGRSPQQIISRLYNCAVEFRGGGVQDDDITMVCLKYNPD